MSRYNTKTEDDRANLISYGFDACGMPGYFLTSKDGDYDTRAFMADDGCHVSRGTLLEMLVGFAERGAYVPQSHLDALALDLPF